MNSVNNKFNNLRMKKRPFKVNWSEEEDKILISMACSQNKQSWKSISFLLNNKTPSQCFYRFHSLNSSLNKRIWTIEEDKIIKDYIQIYGKNWEEISSLLKMRSPKQIKERYLNKLDQNLIRSKFTEEEDKKIISYYLKFGSKWSFISKNFERRTAEMLKSRFYSNLQKKLIVQNCQNFNFNQIDLTQNKVNLFFNIILNFLFLFLKFK